MLGVAGEGSSCPVAQGFAARRGAETLGPIDPDTLARAGPAVPCSRLCPRGSHALGDPPPAGAQSPRLSETSGRAGGGLGPQRPHRDDARSAASAMRK